MKALLAALLLPALSFAAGYPPGTYQFTGLGEPSWLSPNGYDFSLGFTWDGGNSPTTFEPGVGISPGSLTGGWSLTPREGGCCAGDSVNFGNIVNPDVFELDIESGLLNGILIAIWNAGDPEVLDVDFESETYFSVIVNIGGNGMFNRAPGYIVSDVPEPGTLTLLLLCLAAIAARRPRHIRDALRLRSK